MCVISVWCLMYIDIYSGIFYCIFLMQFVLVDVV
jgi:hypothetical protein